MGEPVAHGASPAPAAGPLLRVDDAAAASRASALANELRWMRRMRRRDGAWFLLGLGVSLAVGLTLEIAAVRTTDELRGRALLLLGLLLGSVGVLASTLWWLVRAVERGDTRW